MALSTYHSIDNTTIGLDSQTDYQRNRYAFIFSLENKERLPYLDSANIPTIGIGFNLQDPNILDLVLQAFGVPATSYQGFSNIISPNNSYPSNIALQNALNAEMTRLAGLKPPQANRSTFAFFPGTTGETEMRDAFNILKIV